MEELTLTFRQALVLGLKRQVVGLVHYHRKELASPAAESSPALVDLYRHLEKCLLHGLLAEKFKYLAFLDLLSQLDGLASSCVSSRCGFAIIKDGGSQQSARGRMLAWFRQAIQAGALDESIRLLCRHSALLSRFYQPGSLLTSAEAQTLVALLRGLRAVDVVAESEVAVQASDADIRSEQALYAEWCESHRSVEMGESERLVADMDGFLAGFSSERRRVVHGPGQPAIVQRRPLFGSSLRDLVIDEFRCLQSLVNPKLGTPNQILRLINVINAAIDTPDLFRQRAPLAQVEELVKAMEQEATLPSSVDIAAASIVLTKWLNQLPEPLLGYNHYEAILACQQIEDEEHRRRNLSILVQEMPWYARPLVIRLMVLLQKCTFPSHSSKNKLNIVAVALLATPWLLRPRQKQSLFPPTPEEQERDIMASAAAGGRLVEFIITHHDAVFAKVREDLSTQQAQLARKNFEVRSLQALLSATVDVASCLAKDDNRVVGLIWDLYDSLSVADSRICTNASVALARSQIQSSGKTQGTAILVSDLLRDLRWERCGLTVKGVALGGFNVRGGFLALDCLTAFIRKYSEKATALICDFALNRAQFCSLTQVAIQITSIVGLALGLVSKVGSESIFPVLPELAKQPSWLLLSDSRCFQELFDVGLLCFDDCWRNATERIGEFPSKLTPSTSFQRTALILQDLVSKRPSMIETVWEGWIATKLAAEEALFRSRSPSARSSRKHYSAEYATSDATSGSSGSTNTNMSNTNNTSSSSNSSSGGNTASTSAASNNNNGAGGAGDTAEVTGSNLAQSSKRLVLNSENPDPRLRAKARSRSNTLSSTGSAASASDVNVMVGGESSSRSLCGLQQYRESCDGSTLDNDIFNVRLAAEAEAAEMSVCTPKINAGIRTNVIGASSILTGKHIEQLEAALPVAYQCCDWRLLYKMGLHGSSLDTLLHKAKSYGPMLLVVKDTENTVFGAFLTEPFRVAERDKYYGSGTTCVWTFRSGAIQFYPWSYKNSYFVISSRESLAFGGGGSFAIYLDADLDRGSSGPCDTFNSPCLSFQEEFRCMSCELYAIVSPTDSGHIRASKTV